MSMTAVNTRRTPTGATPRVADLLPRASGGDPGAWEEIVRQYGGLVSATVRSCRLQGTDALDAAQMTWLRLTENAHRVQFPERLGAWLATTARRECLRILHDRAKLAVAPWTWTPSPTHPLAQSSTSSTWIPRRRSVASSLSWRPASGTCYGHCLPTTPGPTPKSLAPLESRSAASGPPERRPCGNSDGWATSTDSERKPDHEECFPAFTSRSSVRRGRLRG
jgi:Sigma-70 region 2